MRRIAGANSASAMPGATTASDEFLEAAMDWKLVMMPQIVPNRPIKAPADPTVASTRQPPLHVLDLARDGDIHDLFDANCRPANERACPSKLRFHSRIAATNSAPFEWPGLRGQRRPTLLR